MTKIYNPYRKQPQRQPPHQIATPGNNAAPRPSIPASYPTWTHEDMKNDNSLTDHTKQPILPPAPTPVTPPSIDTSRTTPNKIPLDEKDTPTKSNKSPKKAKKPPQKKSFKARLKMEIELLKKKKLDKMKMREKEREKEELRKAREEKVRQREEKRRRKQEERDRILDERLKKILEKGFRVPTLELPLNCPEQSRVCDDSRAILPTVDDLAANVTNIDPEISKLSPAMIMNSRVLSSAPPSLETTHKFITVSLKRPPGGTYGIDIRYTTIDLLPTNLKKKKVPHAVLIVSNPGFDQMDAATGNILLKENDILVKIDGDDIGGTTFGNVLDKLRQNLQVELGVVREIPIPICTEIPTLVPSSPSSSKEDTPKQILQLKVTTELTDEEVTTLLHQMKLHQNSNSMWEDIQSHFSSRSISTLQNKWNSISQSLQNRLQINANAEWKRRWTLESPDAQNEPFLTDATRHNLRSLPRPAVGCKCGKISHDRVHSPLCALYRNLRLVSDSDMESSDEGAAQVSSSVKKNGKRVLEVANSERHKKLKSETERDMREASFVQRMERNQLSRGVAILSPSFLTLPVISSIRRSGGGNMTERDLLCAISQTWGHLYIEPSHMEHAWRLYTRDCVLKKKTQRMEDYRVKNRMRQVGHLPFENSLLLVEDNMEKGVIASLSLMTGLAAELKFLTETNAIREIGGNFVLEEHWERKVPMCFLQEVRGMDDRYFIHPDVKARILALDFSGETEWDVQKDLFQRIYCEWFDGMEGVGQFGI